MVLRRRTRRKEHNNTPADLLVVGLGNPGDKYVGTRHNVGAEVIELLAERSGTSLRAGREPAWFGEWRRGDELVALAVPRTFMNLSGEAVRPLVKRFAVTDMQKLVVVHDELDLEPGVVRVKSGGGLAGHNGLRSLRSHLNSTDFTRVRVGVGRPSSDRASVADHVLQRPGRADRDELDIAVQEAADAVELLLDHSVDQVMNRVNAKTNG